MIDIIKKIYFLINFSSQKFKLINLSILMFLNIIFEFVGIVLIIPVITIILKPESYDFDLFNNTYVIGNFINNVAISKEQLLVYLLISIIIIFFIKLLLSLLLNFYSTNFSFKIQTDVGNVLVKNYLNQKYSFFLNKNSSELIRNVFNNTNHISAASLSLIIIFVECFVLLTLTIFLFFYNFKISFLSFVLLFILSVIYYQIIKKKIFQWSVIRDEENAKKLKNISETFSSIKEIFIYSVKKLFISNFSKSNFMSLRPNRNFVFLSSSFRPILEFTIVSLIIFITALIYLRGNNLDILNDIPVFILILIRLIPSVNRIIAGFQRVKFCMFSIETVIKDLSLNKQENTKITLSKLEFAKNIEFKNVSFRYNKDNLIFEKLNLEIHKNEKIGIFGNSGDGKSTFLDLLVGMNDFEGEILVDGISIKKGLESWSKKFCYIPQKVYLLDNTIKKNICFGIADEEINIEKLNLAVEVAQLSKFISRLEQGLDTIIGEDGSRISGGQRQRIGLARAIYRDPEILIMDESTSSLDEQTSEQIMRQVLQLSQNLTLIVVSHNKKVFEGLDKVYQIKNREIKLIDRN